MIPTAFVALDQLPRSPAGKLDRRALPAPDALTAHAVTPPRDELERRLVELWRSVLGVAAVGIHDRFFDLGGHSLSATQLASRIREELAVELPLRVLFEATSVAELAEILRGGAFDAISEAEVDDMSAALDLLENPK
jgi:acyl carrier protein